jgi:hypothetical protein
LKEYRAWIRELNTDLELPHFLQKRREGIVKELDEAMRRVDDLQDSITAIDLRLDPTASADRLSKWHAEVDRLTADRANILNEQQRVAASTEQEQQAETLKEKIAKLMAQMSPEDKADLKNLL